MIRKKRQSNREKNSAKCLGISFKNRFNFFDFMWIVICFSLMSMAFFFQLDRASKSDLRLADFVPQILQSYALESRARRALADGHIKAGYLLTRELVHRRPVPAESWALYTNALINMKDEVRAAPALLAAAKRGWRDRYTQHLLIRVAVASGDWKVAAQRLMALWRVEDQSDSTLDLSQDVLNNFEINNIFSEQMVNGDRWITKFLEWSSVRLPLSHLESTINILKSNRVNLSCRNLSISSYKVAQAGFVKSGEAMWSHFCDNAAKQRLDEFSYFSSGENPGPLTWRLKMSPDGFAEVTRSNGHKVLRYNNAGINRIEIANRFASLEPGVHKIQYDTKFKFPSIMEVSAIIKCYKSKNNERSIKEFSFSDGVSYFTIPENCLSQKIYLLVPSGGGVVPDLKVN